MYVHVRWCIEKYNGRLSHMKSCAPLILCTFLAGCSPVRQAHEREVRAAVEKAGGISVILTESRKLFASLTNKSESIRFLQQGQWLDDLPGIKSLGDVFHYESKMSSLPDRIVIRRYNSHWDTYFIQLIN